MIKTSQRISNHFQRLGTLANANNLTRFYSIGGDINNFTVNSDVLVTYQLACSCTSGSNTQTVNHVIQTAFQQLKKDLACNTFQGSCLLKQVTELFLQYSISIFSFLLLAKLHTILRSFSLSRIAVLAGRIVLLRQNFICSKDTFTEFTGYS